jgi:predicted protein tyrosine phosphatase
LKTEAYKTALHKIKESHREKLGGDFGTWLQYQEAIFLVNTQQYSFEDMPGFIQFLKNKLDAIHC